jgi:hygromycin-B 7''-O-kinase
MDRTGDSADWQFVSSPTAISGTGPRVHGEGRAALRPPWFRSRRVYGARLTDTAFWRPYIEEVCRRHDLACDEVWPGLPGTHAVFIVDRRYAVKLYTHWFGRPEDHLVERMLYEAIARTPELPAPAIVASGDLFPESNAWPWPYTITTVIPGVSAGEARAQMGDEDRLTVARFLGSVLRRAHGLIVDGPERLRRSWEPFNRFVARQRRTCVARHRRRGSLPDAWIAQADRYLPRAMELMVGEGALCLLHGDMTADHVLGEFQDGRWLPTGIIDFGNARSGDPLYELIALHLDLFRCDKRQLSAFLESYGMDVGALDAFVRRAMSYTLLHEFDPLGTLLRVAPAAREVGGLEELAALLWDPKTPDLPL